MVEFTFWDIAYLLLLAIRWLRQRQNAGLWLVELLSMHTLIAPAMVLSVGLYVFFLRRIDLDHWSWGMLLVVVVNTVVLVPFALQQLRPRLWQFDEQYQRLSDNLKLSVWERIRVEWPWLQRTFWSAFALVLVLAIGDVTIFSIFGSSDWQTMPWLIYSYAGTYRMQEAALVSLLLLLICAVIIFALEKGRDHAED